MASHGATANPRQHVNGSITQRDIDTSNAGSSSASMQTPADQDFTDSPTSTMRKLPLESPAIDAESYFNSLKTLQPSSRTGSVSSLSRLSLSNQLSQLTSLVLPDANSLSTSISLIPTAAGAAQTLFTAADHMGTWLMTANKVLKGLDAEDDVEWAAAGGREGLGELDAAIGKFEGLVGLYVEAIENLQTREDISKVSGEDQKELVDQMEWILTDWSQVKKSMKTIKRQVELAMEWEELWNTVLGDIGLELEALSVYVFEMEESRHQHMSKDSLAESMAGLDMQELDTIIEEGTGEVKIKNSRFSLPGNFQVSSPISPGVGIPQDDQRLLALFARMQPLRASLDFLPMTLSGFRNKAKDLLPTACDELDDRRKSLEKKWKQLEAEAEGLREELGEDRWVVIFRNAGRQCQKLCESVEKAISKLQESIDAGTQHSNPPLLAKKVETYEGKKAHYGPAIKKVLAIIEKGVSDRQTVNGEIIRLRDDSKARWRAIEAQMKEIDAALDELTINKDQQLRDSISSIVSRDRSATGSSAIDTPGSSPASSVALGPVSGNKRDASPGMNSTSRRSSIGRPSVSSRRYFSMSQSSANSTQLPRNTSNPRPLTSTTSSRNASPSPYAKSSATPTPGSRSTRPTLSADSKPRWNSSSKVDYFEFGSKPRHLPFSQPSSGRKSALSGPSYRSPSNLGVHSSPLGRASPAPPHHTPHLAGESATRNYFGGRRASTTSTMIAKDTAGAGDWVKVKDKTPPNSSDGPARRPRINIDTSPSTPPSTFGDENSPSLRPRPQRPSTAMGNITGRRISMLPVPTGGTPHLSSLTNNASKGTPLHPASTGRASSLGARAAAVSASVIHGRNGASTNGKTSNPLRGVWR